MDGSGGRDGPGGDGSFSGGASRAVVLLLGVVLLVVGAYVLSASVGAGPGYGIVAGLVASVLGIELIAYGLTGRLFGTTRRRFS